MCFKRTIRVRRRLKVVTRISRVEFHFVHVHEVVLWWFHRRTTKPRTAGKKSGTQEHTNRLRAASELTRFESTSLGRSKVSGPSRRLAVTNGDSQNQKTLLKVQRRADVASRRLIVFVRTLHPNERLNIDQIARSQVLQITADGLCEIKKLSVDSP